MATVTKEVKTEETVAKKVTPKAEKKVAAPKVEKKVTTVKKVEDSVKETATKVSDNVKDTATKVADAAKSGIDTVKDTYTDVEIAISDARVSGNARAKKILTSVFDDNANDVVVDFVGYLGEVTAVCSKVICSPMTVPTNKLNTLYKKITA